MALKLHSSAEKLPQNGRAEAFARFARQDRDIWLAYAETLRARLAFVEARARQCEARAQSFEAAAAR